MSLAGRLSGGYAWVGGAHAFGDCDGKGQPKGYLTRTWLWSGRRLRATMCAIATFDPRP